ncbi:MAG: putative TetR family transcriptional regulator [Nocardioidaceae bacterium]|nr:putative TetR family transcriptional regulator [Nocardioidaceae bacterium]
MVASPARTAARKRVQLDREVILQAVFDLSAQGRPITFRALGTALGADPTAVYRHFRDKDELVRGAFDRLLTVVLERVDPDAPWRDQLRQSAVATLDICEQYPSIGAEARALTTRGPGELGAVEHLLSQFQRAGLDQSAAVRFYSAFSGYLLAIAATAATIVLDTNDTDPGDRSWLGDVGPVDATQFPAVAAARTELASLQDRDVFMMGIDVLLDAVETAAQPSKRSDKA